MSCKREIKLQASPGEFERAKQIGIHVDENNKMELSEDGELFVTSLKNMLDTQFEHFGQQNDHLLGMWAGPEHWRKKAKRPKLAPAGPSGPGVDEEFAPGGYTSLFHFQWSSY
ncbi:unnamed protein product [Protopolystoma xenopodis]|uniref:Uncharacterized protein n=1 Tax=Protopolystoma xenopodis TaxID=117903 RepID=A0A448X634_9PLAT|nr:unnamed protein product [Protopolystoma xenopodis]